MNDKLSKREIEILKSAIFGRTVEKSLKSLANVEKFLKDNKHDKGIVESLIIRKRDKC